MAIRLKISCYFENMPNMKVNYQFYENNCIRADITTHIYCDQIYAHCDTNKMLVLRFYELAYSIDGVNQIWILRYHAQAKWKKIVNQVSYHVQPYWTKAVI